MRLVNYVTLQSYKSNNLFYVRTVDPDALKTINHTVAVFVLILVLALLVPLILMICFSNYFSTRITTLKSAMHRASLGDYNIIEQFRGDDELSDTFKDLKLTVDAIHDKEAQFYEARIREQQLVNRQQQMEFEMLASQINRISCIILWKQSGCRHSPVATGMWQLPLNCLEIHALRAR